MKKGDRVKTFHRYTYRPAGCETATVMNIFWDDISDRMQVKLSYDNGAEDFTPLDGFNKLSNNGEPSYILI